MCPLVGWAGKVSESSVFQLKFPTVLINRIFRKSNGPRSPGRQAFPPDDARRMIDALVVEEIALLVPQPANRPAEQPRDRRADRRYVARRRRAIASG